MLGIGSMEHSAVRALTIAGSDSGGGAGIQADLKTFTSLEVFGTSVLTCVTSQNTLKVDGIHTIPADFVNQQLKAVLDDIGTDAIKIGMMCNSDIMKNLATTLRAFYKNVHPIPNLVVDPVMISTSGSDLIDDCAIRTLIEEILPLSMILTPNVPEAIRLLKESERINNNTPSGLSKIATSDEMKLAAKALARLGPPIVLLKGGHLPFYKSSGQAVCSSILDNCSFNPDEAIEIVDVVYDSRADEFTEFRKDYIRTKNTHGTGCTLSAAIAAYLSLGYQAVESIQKGAEYVNSAIRADLKIGKGGGPLNHFHAIVQRSIERPSKFNPHPLTSYLLNACKVEWKAYTEHPFVEGIGNGTLPKENFVHYIIQDYFFLENYARAHALGAYKAKGLIEAKEFANTVISITHEVKLHLNLCASWGITLDQIQATPESMANVAYTRYVLDVGATGDILDLILVMTPCSIGYGQIGTRLFNDPKTVKGPENPYWEWISNYAGEDYQSSVTKNIDEIERLALLVQPSRIRLNQLEKIFRQATKLETAFWDMGMTRA